eukprot:1193743-Prorocentrum_minimum.AAC.3
MGRFHTIEGLICSSSLRKKLTARRDKPKTPCTGEHSPSGLLERARDEKHHKLLVFPTKYVITVTAGQVPEQSKPGLWQQFRARRSVGTRKTPATFRPLCSPRWS